MANDDFNVAAYEHFNQLVQCLEDYRQQLAEERESAGDNMDLQRLIGLQVKRINLMLDYLDSDGDETLRDLIDRGHVLEQARQGKFV